MVVGVYSPADPSPNTPVSDNPGTRYQSDVPPSKRPQQVPPGSARYSQRRQGPRNAGACEFSATVVFVKSRIVNVLQALVLINLMPTTQLQENQHCRVTRL